MNVAIKLIPGPFITILFLMMQATLFAQSVNVGGSDWTVSPATITEAGNDYSNPYKSSTSQILVTASAPGGIIWSGRGNVNVRYEGNPTWNSSLKLTATRTGSGSASCLCVFPSISGGTSPGVEIETTDKLFFTINSGVLSLGITYSSVPVEIDLSGVSVTVPAAVYTAKIIFTITN